MQHRWFPLIFSASLTTLCHASASGSTTIATALLHSQAYAGSFFNGEQRAGGAQRTGLHGSASASAVVVGAEASATASGRRVGLGDYSFSLSSAGRKDPIDVSASLVTSSSVIINFSVADVASQVRVRGGITVDTFASTDPVDFYLIAQRLDGNSWNVVNAITGRPSTFDYMTPSLAPGEYRMVAGAQKQISFSAGASSTALAFDARFTFEDALESVGLVQQNPVLPDANGSGVPLFTGAPSGNWFDPPATDGFKFDMTGTSKFTDILSLPVDIDTDGQFTLVAEGQTLGSFAAGASVNFVDLLGHAVTSFTVLGIDPVVNAESPTAFPIQLAFDTATADFTMTPSTLFAEGDATLDGRVNFADLVALAQHYGRADAHWHNGDFNFDGVTNFADLVMLAKNYNTGVANVATLGNASLTADWALAQSLVPEPAAFALLAGVGIVSGPRRRLHG
jgi:hypothetical protein